MKYIENHTPCSKEDVVRGLAKDQLASRMVVRKLLTELEQESIVISILEKDNSKIIQTLC